MPNRTEDKPPQRPIRTENQFEQMTQIINPERNDQEIYEDPITRNQTLANFNVAGEDLQKELYFLYELLVSENELEAAAVIKGQMQNSANVSRGVGGLTSEQVTSYTYKEHKTLKTDEKKGNIPINSTQGGIK
jgi:hypothetical protein